MKGWSALNLKRIGGGPGIGGRNIMPGINFKVTGLEYDLLSNYKANFIIDNVLVTKLKLDLELDVI